MNTLFAEIEAWLKSQPNYSSVLSQSRWFESEDIRVYLRWTQRPARYFGLTTAGDFFLRCIDLANVSVPEARRMQGNYSDLLEFLCRPEFPPVFVENANPEHSALYLRRGFKPIHMNEAHHFYYPKGELL